MSQSEINALITSMLAENTPVALADLAPGAYNDLPDLGPITQEQVNAVAAAAEAARKPAHPYEGLMPEPDAASAPAPAAPVQPATAAQAILMEISLALTVELGRTRMPLKQVLALAPGSIITLDRLAAEPVPVYINNTPVMTAEVVVIGEHYGVRITEARLATRKAS